MNFAAIANIGALGGLVNRPVQFCLAQHYLDEGLPAYKAFYDNQVRIGRVVILDNGCWEEDLVSFDNLYKALSLLRPRMVVLPDVMGDAKLTRYLSEAFASFCAQAGSLEPEPWFTHFMYVLQGEDIFSLLHEYRTSPWEYIGLPRRLGALRVELCQRLHQLGLWEPKRYVHALGMVEGNVNELADLARLGVHSADSSNPVWRSGGAKGDFDVESSHPLSFIAIHNLKEIDTRCVGPSTSEILSSSLSDEEVPF